MIAGILATIRRVPPAGRACFVIAFVNAAIWTILIPPFQVPDEVVHFAYAQYVAETGRPPPQGPAARCSPQEDAALAGLPATTVIGHSDVRGVVSAGEDRILRAALAAHPSPTGPGGASPATNQPPLYYVLEAVPYWLSPSSDILARLELMRLLSAVFGAATVLCVFLFLRELFRERPWMWTVGALAVAFQPQFMFITAGVHVDSLLYLASAAVFLALIRAWRRGLTVRRAAVIGAVTAVGLLTKLTFVAFLPGIALAVAMLAWRALPGGGRQTLRAVAVTAATAAAPVAVYALLNASAWHRGATAAGFASVTAAAGGHAVSIHESLDYIWQLYLPVLPFMNHVYFPGGYPLWDVWLNGSIGHFGWLDYGFPPWVYTDGGGCSTHSSRSPSPPASVCPGGGSGRSCRSSSPSSSWRSACWRRSAGKASATACRPASRSSRPATCSRSCRSMACSSRWRRAAPPGAGRRSSAPGSSCSRWHTASSPRR